MPHGITFWRRLRELREARNLTQRELAEMVAARLKGRGRGFDFTYLSKIENNKTPPPSIPVIIQLARILGENPDELIALAGKAPRGLDRILQESALARSFFCVVANSRPTDRDWMRLLAYLRISGDSNGGRKTQRSGKGANHRIAEARA
jgi:transcriptional regulator with XRE-family HTH domain